MKLKFLLTTLSCTALFSGSILPVVAETAKETFTKPQSVGIQNKQSAAELYDRWSGEAFEKYQQGNRESLERYNNTLQDIEERTEARKRARIAREQAVRARLDTGLVGYWKASVNETGTPTNIFWNIKTDGTTAYVFQTSQGNGGANSTWNYSDGIWYEGLSSGLTAKASIQWVSKDEFILTIIDNGNPQYAGVKRRFIRDRQATNRGLQEARDNYGDANNGTNQLRSNNTGYGRWNH